MTKKDYIIAAKMIRSQMSWGATKDEANPFVIQAFTEFFRDDNPLFDEKRFREACRSKK
jgi:hypothetical protein